MDEYGRRATIANYFTRENAQAAIDSWIERYYRGERSDITLDKLSSLTIEEY